MKKLLLIFLLFPLSVFSQEWIKLGTNITGTVFYYDKESLKILGNKRFVLTMFDYIEPNLGDLSSQSYQTIDCDEYTIEVTLFRSYVLPMGNGEVNTSFNLNDKITVSRSDNDFNHYLVSTLCE
jgi:hypothetical protein|tara:strand:+ start:73 stop:444 length:372 start_codon:yes stop_codon:yes gene_type:complete